MYDSEMFNANLRKWHAEMEHAINGKTLEMMKKERTRISSSDWKAASCHYHMTLKKKDVSKTFISALLKL